MDIEMPETALIERIDVIVTTVFPSGSAIKVGNPTTADAYLASTVLTHATNAITSANAKRFGALDANKKVVVTVTGTGDSTTGRAYIQIWHVFAPNSEWKLDPDDPAKYMVQPNYLLL
jgi:UDP-N-acetylmuramyl tripeptide synthase